MALKRKEVSHLIGLQEVRAGEKKQTLYSSISGSRFLVLSDFLLLTSAGDILKAF